MCLLIVHYAAETTPLDFTDFYTAWNANPDGFGVGFVMDGVLRAEHEPLDPDAALELYTEAFYGRDQGTAMLAHWRMSTSGPDDALHPFRCGRNNAVLAAHNGVLGDGRKDASDTQIFLRTVAWNRTPTELLGRGFRRAIGQEIGWNKLAFLDVRGKVSVVNHGLGETYGQTWHSNGCLRNPPKPKYWIQKWDRDAATETLVEEVEECEREHEQAEIDFFSLQHAIRDYDTSEHERETTIFRRRK
jgi:hypothetical protein